MTQLVFYFFLFPSLLLAAVNPDNNFDANIREACYGQILLSAKNSLKLFDKLKKAQESYRNDEFINLGLRPIAKIVPGELYSKKFNQIWNDMVEDVNLSQGNLTADKSKEYTLKLGAEFEKVNKKFMGECSAIYSNFFTLCQVQMGTQPTEVQKDCIQKEVPRLKKVIDPLVTNLLTADKQFEHLDKELDVTVKLSKATKKAERLVREMEDTGCHPEVIKTKLMFYIVKHHNHGYLKLFRDLIKNDGELIHATLQDKFLLIREAGRKHDLTFFKEMLKLKFPYLTKADKKMLISQMKNKNAIKLIR